MLSKVIAAAVIAAACLSASVSAPVQAQEKQYNQIGAWKIIARYEKGRLHRCIAQTDSASGMLRIAHFPNGTWNFSVPCFGRNTNSEVETHLGSELGRLRMHTEMKGCRTWTDPLSRDWSEQLRTGGKLTLIIGRDKPTWNLANVKNAMASAEACVRSNR
jgi:hypothetical protein